MKLDHSSSAPEGIKNELCGAVMNGNTKMLQLVLNHIDKLEEYQVSFAVQAATIYEQQDMIQFFLDMGYSGELIDANKWSALDQAAYCGRTDAVQLLIDNGANVNEDKVNDPLDYAITDGNNEIVKCLLENGAKPNITHLIDAIQKANLEDV